MKYRRRNTVYFFSMPKLHTNHAAKKRFKITASGKILAKGAGKQHLNEHMSAKRKRHIRTPKIQVPKELKEHVLRQIPYVKYAR